MTITQQIITIGLYIAGTMLTRFLPFAIFNEKRKTPAFVQYLGKFLPSAVFGMLVVYCLRNVHVLSLQCLGTYTQKPLSYVPSPQCLGTYTQKELPHIPFSFSNGTFL